MPEFLLFDVVLLLRPVAEALFFVRVVLVLLLLLPLEALDAEARLEERCVVALRVPLLRLAGNFLTLMSSPASFTLPTARSVIVSSA